MAGWSEHVARMIIFFGLQLIFTLDFRLVRVHLLSSCIIHWYFGIFFLSCKPPLSLTIIEYISHLPTSTAFPFLLLSLHMIPDLRTRRMVTTRFFDLVARNSAITSGADIPVISRPSISVRTSPSWMPRILACPFTLATIGPRADEVTLMPNGPGC